MLEIRYMMIDGVSEISVEASPTMTDPKYAVPQYFGKNHGNI